MNLYIRARERETLPKAPSRSEETGFRPGSACGPCLQGSAAQHIKDVRLHTSHPLKSESLRTGQDVETLMHRWWECKTVQLPQLNTVTA